MPADLHDIRGGVSRLRCLRLVEWDFQTQQSWCTPGCCPRGEAMTDRKKPGVTAVGQFELLSRLSNRLMISSADQT
jgi:hypothetical protein